MPDGSPAAAPTVHWPEHVWSDYPSAIVRLVTLAAARTSHLLFGCVELLPSEIPQPAPTPPERIAARVSRVTYSMQAMPSRDAVAWYESALAGRLAVPGIRPAAEVATVSLAAEPRLGEFVVARRPPVSADWHAQPRLHRLVPMQEVPAPIRDLFSGGVGQEKGLHLRRWIADRVHFDLLATDDCLGGLVLLAPNPVLRCLQERLEDADAHGDEAVRVAVVPRQGQDLSTLEVRLREERPDGATWIARSRLDEFGMAEIRCPGRVGNTALELECGVRGLLASREPTGFITSVDVGMRVVTHETSVEVPARRKGDRPVRYTGRLASGTPERTPIHEAPPTAMHRLEVLRERRRARPEADRIHASPYAWLPDEKLFNMDRGGAVDFLQSIVARARRHAIFVDPYFDHRDIREFALAVQDSGCRISVLTGRGEPRWAEPDPLTGSPEPRGSTLLADLAGLNRQLGRTGLPPIDVRVMGGRANGYHDRFLVVDDQAWALGHSFNAIGQDAVSVVVRVRKPGELVALIAEDVARAQPFAEAWAEILEARAAAASRAIPRRPSGAKDAGSGRPPR